MALNTIPGVELKDYEAIGSGPQDGTMTMGSRTDYMSAEELFASQGADLTGIVAAQGTVDGVQAYRALTKSADVLLVDVTPEVIEQAATTNPALRSIVGDSRVDALVNDIYWEFAGLVS